MINMLTKWLKRITLFLWCISMVILGLWILYENNIRVDVNYYGIEYENQVLGLVMVKMLVLGVAIGYFTNVLTAKNKVFWSQRRYKKASRELEKLKGLHPKGE